MSTATKRVMEDAIEAHLSDEYEESAMLNGYILQASGSVISDDRTALIYCGKGNQSGVTTMGLLAYINYNAEGVSFNGGDEDE
jgi:hypothetical protein